MKDAIIVALACALVSLAGSLRAGPPPGYYAPADNLTGGPLKQALHGIIVNHTVIGYNSLIAPLRVIWRDPANSSNILLSYSHTSVPATASWNREHLWPRSRGNSDQAGPDDSDLFHVVPTDNSVNAERASLYFDESDPGDPGYRIPAHSLAPQTSRDTDSWQPPPQERGDIARALFYMDVCYDGQAPQTTDFDLVSFPPTGSQMGRLNTLLLWNQQDPPDDAERARNDLIYNDYQHNRNPFIDHPEYVTAIWGSGTPTGGGSRPIARLATVSASAVELPSTSATFQVTLNQFAAEGGLAVVFTMSGTAAFTDYHLSGTGLTYDPATGTGRVVIPANFSSVLLTLTAVNDGVAEPAETAVATLTEGVDYTAAAGAAAAATLTITDAASLPVSWSFNAGAPFANPLPANTGAGSISFTGWRGSINSFAGSSGLGLGLIGMAGNGSWIDLRLSMSGYTGLMLNFATRGTSAGFTTGTWSASADGVNFTALAGVNTASTSTSFVSKQVNFSGLSQLTDAPDVTLRYTLSGATSNDGNNRIDELTLSATALSAGQTRRTVSIAASDPSANELTLDPGTFTVQLSGLAPAGGLDVTLSFASGTATAPGLAGADYSFTGLSSYDSATKTGHVFFPEGAGTALITVTPLADARAEGGETVIGSIVSSPNYLVGAGNQAIVTISETPVNDAFASALGLAGTEVSTTGSNVGATRETGEPTHAASGTHSVWWRWTAPTDGVVQIHTRGSNFDSLLGVYTGSSVSALTQVGANDNDGAGNQTSLLNLRVKSGVAYSIVVDGYGAQSGQIALSLLLLPNPTVTVTAPVPAAQEKGSVAAVARFTLSERVPLPTSVVITLGGTAQAGADYTTASGSYTTVAIPAGASSADLALIPVTDGNTLEGTETINLTVGTSSTYDLPPGGPNSVSLSLADDSPYSAAWIAEHPNLTPEMAAPLGDADADGIPTLLEYLAGRDPGKADGAPLLTIRPERFVDPADGVQKMFAAMRFKHRAGTENIRLVLEARSALKAGEWAAGGVFISATPLADASFEEVLYRSTTPLTDPGTVSTFFRLKATVP